MSPADALAAPVEQARTSFRAVMVVTTARGEETEWYWATAHQMQDEGQERSHPPAAGPAVDGGCAGIDGGC